METRSLRHRAAQAQLLLATTRFDYNPNQRRADDGKWTDGGMPDDTGLKGLSVQSAEEYEDAYGDVFDEQSVDLGDGRSLTARYFTNGDAHVVLDLPGGKSQVFEEMTPDSMRALADNLDEMVEFDNEDEDAGGGDIVADIDSTEHGFYLARDGVGDIRVQPDAENNEEYFELGESEAAEFAEALRRVAGDYEDEFE